MKKIDWKSLTKRRSLGLIVMALGLAVLLMPVLVGGWILALLGIALIVVGLFEFVETVRSADKTSSFVAYATGIITTLLGAAMFFSPNLALSGLLIGVALFLAADGAVRIYGAFKQSARERWWNLFNGLFSIALGFLIWYLLTARLGIAAIGISLGLWLLVEGWTMFFLPEKGFEEEDFSPDPSEHPDYRLALEASETIKEIQEPLLQVFPVANSQNVVWCLTLLGIFFLIHALRTDSQWNFIGLISPFAAVVGDAVVALLLGVVLILPLRIFWRRLTRPVERVAWRRFFYLKEKNEEPSVGERLLKFWLAGRMRFAIEMRQIRYSLNYAFWRVLRVGLPLTAILIAVNSIWGFSWYFNSENWASAVWQEITKERVDVWRKAAAEKVERDALAKGVAPEKVFAIEPDGVAAAQGDFSFVVIGDTGEGDPSQMALRDQIIAAGRREQVKFLVLSSDVIYPDGKMKDYERNFYLPFKGFEKPIYAIPGNHDWFDANEGFNANFLSGDAALLSLRARLEEDVKNVITTDERFAEITREAERLRSYYRIRNGLQRAPFFEMHTDGFSLVCADTGILRRLDEKQKAWFEAALQRAGGNFKMVVLGHPFYVAGKYQGGDDADFNAIYELLKRYDVNVAMAGDTHDFEFYRINAAAADNGAAKEMLHFVNGGGGAYLSIGTAVGFPEKPDTQHYAFYPRTDEITAKISNEAPVWKYPFYWWLKWLHGYPFDSEMVSGAFDFNRAPFFQSFLEVSVERSNNRVRFLLYGVNGQLRWRDIQTGGLVKPADQSDDDPVEFIAPLAD